MTFDRAIYCTIHIIGLLSSYCHVCICLYVSVLCGECELITNQFALLIEAGVMLATTIAITTIRGVPSGNEGHLGPVHTDSGLWLGNNFFFFLPISMVVDKLICLF